MEGTERKNRVIVITGGASGIGRAMADAFVHCGDQVVIIGRHENTLRATADAIGPNCSWQRADISQCDQVEAAVNAIVARFHEIDVLINNAGYSGYERGMTSDMALDQVEEIWNEAIGVNLTGAFLMTFAAAPYLTRLGGRIINISSDGALTDEIIKGIAGQLPVRRPGHVEDIATAALFLASPEAGFITGELLNVNGGRVFGR